MRDGSRDWLTKIAYDVAALVDKPTVREWFRACILRWREAAEKRGNEEAEQEQKRRGTDEKVNRYIHWPFPLREFDGEPGEPIPMSMDEKYVVLALIHDALIQNTEALNPWPADEPETAGKGSPADWRHGAFVAQCRQIQRGSLSLTGQRDLRPLWLATDKLPLRAIFKTVLADVELQPALAALPAKIKKPSRKTTLDETNVKVREYLRLHPKATVRQVAAMTGCSRATISRTPAWQGVKSALAEGRKPKACQSAEVYATIDDQERDARQKRLYKRV